MKRVVATICSRAKLATSTAVPVRKLYTAPHVQHAWAMAQESGVPLYILSGKYGFIESGEEKLPYDERLNPQDVHALGQLMAHQCRHDGIDYIDLYAEFAKESWHPYLQAFTIGATLARVQVIEHTLEPA